MLTEDIRGRSQYPRAVADDVLRAERAGPDVAVLPVLVGRTRPQSVSALLAALLAVDGAVAVVSTDLSDYLDERSATSGIGALPTRFWPATPAPCDGTTPVAITPWAGCGTTPPSAT